MLNLFKHIYKKNSSLFLHNTIIFVWRWSWTKAVENHEIWNLNFLCNYFLIPLYTRKLIITISTLYSCKNEFGYPDWNLLSSLRTSHVTAFLLIILVWFNLAKNYLVSSIAKYEKRMLLSVINLCAYREFQILVMSFKLMTFPHDCTS